MATLSENARVGCWSQWMRENLDLITGALTKQELRAAIDAADDWAEANASAFNSALPQPARGVLSAAQKAMILNVVIARRYIERV